MQKIFLLIIIIIACSCSDEIESNLPEVLLCDALLKDVEENDMNFSRFHDESNIFVSDLEQSEPLILIDEYIAFLNRTECLSAHLDCFECVESDPPISLVKTTRSADRRDTISIEILSFEEAREIRIFRVLN